MKSVLQTENWARLKEKQSWVIHKIGDFYVLEKKLPLALSFLYAPELDLEDLKNNFKKILKEVGDISKSEKTIFFRIEPLKENNEKDQKFLENLGFIPAFEEIQPSQRQWLDITKSDEEILAQMKPKGRYNIKIAQREKVKIRQSVNPKDVTIFYDLFEITSKRAQITYRKKQYFLDLINAFKPENIAIFVAEYKRKPLSAAIISFYQGIASYLYGASSNENRNVMAPYLMHWEIIKEAKKRDCWLYDLLNITESEDKNHPWFGITRFKKQFGGREVRLLGGFDLVFNQFWYKLFKLAEKARRPKQSLKKVKN